VLQAKSAYENLFIFFATNIDTKLIVHTPIQLGSWEAIRLGSLKNSGSLVFRPFSFRASQLILIGF
jgi:hypothetical protein